MLFEEVRHVGTSLLASAGIVGIIAGLAAQKTLTNVIAGFQIALAQLLRQDDVVVVVDFIQKHRPNGLPKLRAYVVESQAADQAADKGRPNMPANR